MKNEHIVNIMAILSASNPEPPLISSHAETESPDPFLILIATLLSLRTKDEVTATAADRLFARAKNPPEMLRLPEEEIAQLIYPVGFYRVKAKSIHQVCRDLIDRFDGHVPDSLDELLSIKAVGRKTANLVISLAFNKDAICVDTHVHRISNRLGYISTKSPEETEFALCAKLPKSLWRSYNTLLVAFGRTICRPLSPLCSRCPVADFCDRVGVTKSR